MINYELVPRDFFRALEARRVELRMPVTVLAKRAGLALRTVQRALSGEADDATLSTVARLAFVLGLTLTFKPDAGMRRRVAREKATRLAAMVQGTSALEDQAIDDRALKQITEQIADELLVGSGSKLWNE